VIAQAAGWMAGAEGIALRWYRWDVAAARGGVLMLHGFGDHAGRYHDVARVLNARGYSVLAYDERGHGASEGPRGHADSFDLYLSDVDAAWAEARRSLRGPHFLYGHSFGGLTAMRWLQTRPQQRPAGVVLSAPWLATALRVPRYKRLAAGVLLRLAPALTISSGANIPENLTRDPQRAAEYLNDPLVHHLISARFHAEAERAQAAARATPLPSGVPALLIVPGDDPLVDAGPTLQWAREHGRGVEVRVREGGRHELHNDLDRDQVLTAVADWLDACGGSNP
jgi:alpha-beta hydrolase superfamily lysophospholipase